MVDEEGKRYLSDRDAINRQGENPWNLSACAFIIAGLSGAATRRRSSA